MQIKYAKENFNFLYRMLEWFLENTQVLEVKGAIDILMRKIRGCHSWEFSDDIFIILDLDDSDISTLLYVYENSLFVTYEAKVIMNLCNDEFSLLKEIDKKGRV